MQKNKEETLQNTRHEILDTLNTKYGFSWSEIKRLDNIELLEVWNKTFSSKYISFLGFEPNRRGAF